MFKRAVWIQWVESDHLQVLLMNANKGSKMETF